MKPELIIIELARNEEVFKQMLFECPEELIHWKPQPDKWCILEILCHLYDEEREDFRFRTKFVLENPGETPPSFDPSKWVTERKYAEQDFNSKLSQFLEERQESMKWLNSLKDPKWGNSFEHRILGPMSAGLFLSNWLAHDFIHIRQINRNRYQYLELNSEHKLAYAGNW